MNKIISILLKEAKIAAKKKEIPVAAIIVRNNQIISKAHNKRKNGNVIGHAEVIAILKACKKLKDWRLNDCDLYVTLKPCEMCNAIIKETRIANVFYLIEPLDFKKQYSKTQFKKIEENYNNEAGEYNKLISDFFSKMR